MMMTQADESKKNLILRDYITSNEYYNIQSASINVAASLLARVASISAMLTIVTVYIVGALTSPLPLWPLTTISVYGATLPAAYFFRAGFITTGNCIILLALAINRHKYFNRNYIILLTGGFCLLTCASISCTENNSVHSLFAICFFLMLGIFQLSIGYKLSQKANPTAQEKHLKCVGICSGLYVLTEILIVALMAAKVLHLPKHVVLPSFEWSGIIVILGFLYYFHDFLTIVR